MQTFKPLQSKTHITPMPMTPLSSMYPSLRPSGTRMSQPSFAPDASQQIPSSSQTQIEQTAPIGYSFAHIPVLPPDHSASTNPQTEQPLTQVIQRQIADSDKPLEKSSTPVTSSSEGGYKRERLS